MSHVILKESTLIQLSVIVSEFYLFLCKRMDFSNPKFNEHANCICHITGPGVFVFHL